MITVAQAKEWLRILNDDDDQLLARLITRSQAIIKASTGIDYEYEDDINTHNQFL